MPAKDSTVLPSANTNTPGHPVASELLTPGDFGIPVKQRYYLSELVPYLCKLADDPVAQTRAKEATLRVLERLCSAGAIRGLHVGRNIVLPREELERVFVEMNTLVSRN